MKKLLLVCIGLVGGSFAVNAQFNATVDSTATWNGYMLVTDLGGNYQFDQSWGPSDLRANFGEGVLTLGPNTNAYDDAISSGDSNAIAYWTDGAGGGNKNMTATFYSENLGARGQTLNFSGTVESNTLTQAHTAVAFIKYLDSSNNWSVLSETTTPLSVGAFSLNLAIPSGENIIPQYGFQMVGINAPSGHSFGNVVITAVPEPSTWALIGGLFALVFVGMRRYRSAKN